MIGTYQTTTDYSIFNAIDGNRAVDKKHKDAIKKSMSERLLFTVITVNEKMQVIDGQHRLAALSELGLPVNYQVSPGYTLHDVHRINNNVKKWTYDDYMNGYCAMGLRPYLEYREFKKYTGFGHNECMVVFSGVANLSSVPEDFKSGNLKIKNSHAAYEFAKKVLSLAEYYPGYKRRSFILAMYSLSRNSQFSFDRFVQKLALNRSMMYDCPTAKLYTELIEKIYNYRSHEKVNLRYSK